MRILHLVNNLDCGGLERFAIDLATQTQRMGHEAQICCLEHSGELAPAAVAAGVEVDELRRGPGFDFRLVWRLAQKLRAAKVDVIHTHNKAPLIYGSLAHWLARTRGNVHTRHGREDTATHRMIWALTDQVVTISEDTRQQVVDSNPVDPAKVSVINNGIPVANFDRAQREHQQPIGLPELGPAGKRIGIVARLAPEKDHATLLRAFAQVNLQLPSVQLVVVGDGPLNESLNQLAKDLGIASSVYFAGFQTNVDQWLSCLDVFVLSSVTEGMSLTLLEAMAASVPIVATDVGGNAEVVQHEKTGFIVPAEDHEALARNLILLLGDPHLCEQMGKAGLERVKSEFNVETMTQRYIEVYRGAAGL